MAKTKLHFTEHGIDAHSETSVWELIPLTVEWQIEQRDFTIGNKQGFRISINLGIIFSMTAFVESLNIDILEELWQSLPQTQSDKLLHEKITKAQFEEQLKIFKLAFEKPLQQILTPELFESIKILFTLRNQLMHGIKLQFRATQNATDPSKTKHEITNKKLSDVFEFFIKRKLANPPEHQTSNQQYGLLGDTVISYYYQILKDYYDCITMLSPDTQYYKDHNPFAK